MPLPSIDIWKCQRFFKTWCHRLLFETSSSELPSIGISPKTCHDRCRSVEFSFRQRSPNFVPCHSSKTFLYQVASINNTVTPRDDPYLPTYLPSGTLPTIRQRLFCTKQRAWIRIPLRQGTIPWKRTPVAVNLLPTMICTGPIPKINKPVVNGDQNFPPSRKWHPSISRLPPIIRRSSCKWGYHTIRYLVCTNPYATIGT